MCYLFDPCRREGNGKGIVDCIRNRTMYWNTWSSFGGPVWKDRRRCVTGNTS
ncbi:hypothetical protein ACRRTK_019537 [Alexandromys fortis]